MARRQLNREQKQELIREQLRETPEKSNVQIANSLGVTDKTVASQRKALEATSEIPRLEKTIGADGKERPRKTERKPTPKAAPVQESPKPEEQCKPVSIFNPSKREEKAVQNPDVVEKMADTGKSAIARTRP